MQKGAKQCCNTEMPDHNAMFWPSTTEHWAQSMFVVSHHCLTTKHDRTHWSSTRKISTIAVCDITALFDIYLVETDIDISRYLGTLFGVNRH